MPLQKLYSQVFSAIFRVSEAPPFQHTMKWLARCLVNLYDLSHDGTVVIKIPFSSTPSHSFHGHHLMRLHPSVYYIANRHYKAIMGAYGRVRFVLLCTVYILKIASYDKFVLASTIPPSGKSPVVQSSIVAPVVKVSSALTTAKGFSSVITPVASPSATLEEESRYKPSIALQAFPSANTLVWSSAVRLPTTFGAGPVRVEPTTTTTTSSLNGQSTTLIGVASFPTTTFVTSSGEINAKYPRAASTSIDVSLPYVATQTIVNVGSSIAASFTPAALHSAPQWISLTQVTTALTSTADTVEPTIASTVKPTIIPSVNVDGCHNYTVLSEADRAQGHIAINASNYRGDEYDLVPGWYRFQGAAGDRMADKCVPLDHCGSRYPVWLSGAHPTVAEGVVIRRVCFSAYQCCSWNQNISVKNCGAYFVYALPRLYWFHPSRYCGNGSGVDGCHNYTVLSEADRAQGHIVTNTNNYRRDRSDLVPGWYRFQGAAGDRMADKCVPMDHCGTEYPGWLSGAHPTGAEGVVIRRVCISASQCCSWYQNIRVRNCGAYFVYALPRLFYNDFMRYCGNGSDVDGCHSYTVLSEADRAQGHISSNYRSDYIDLVPGWYRFQGAAGDRMVDRCVPMDHCGTKYPGWLNGTHPTVAEGAVIRRVCFHISNNCCYWFQNIRVKNCGAYFVYALPRLYHYLYHYHYSSRYCGNGRAVVTCSNLSPPTNGELLACNATQMIYSTVCTFSCNEGFEGKGSVVRSCTENGTWSGTDLVCTVRPGVNTTAIVNVTEDGSLTINCSIGTDLPEWSRRDGDAVETKTRKIDGVLLHIENASIADTGVYECKLGKALHTIWVQVLVRVEVEMELVVENYVFTEELKNKSTPAYKETEKNFTTEMDKVHRGVTEGYVRTEVLGFTKGSVQVDFRIIIQLVTSDPENATDLPDVKAETAQRVVVKAETGFVERLQVKKVIVKTVPLEPTNVEIFGIDSDELSVQWNPSENADAFKVTEYRVQHRKFEEKSFTNTSLIASDDKTQYTIRVQPLEPETTYMVRVGALNKFGENFNDESAHQTDPAPFPWWIIVVVVLIILLVLVILVVLIVYKRKRNREREAQQVGAQFDALESLKDEVASNTDKKVKGIAYFSNDAYKPSELNWDEIPYKDLKLLDELGSGAFGVVYKGEYLQDNGNVLPCAVKALKPSATSEEIRDLYNELEIMGNVGYHPNLVNLIGACTEDGHLLVVLEIAENGSLIEFLKKSRQTDQSFENVNSGLTEQMKTSIATDVARGMAHLAKCKCIHRDLAARNVLLGKDYIAKVSDYGMARDVYEDLMYKKETQGKLPVRWMAIESLQTYIFTMESDVWSYGVLLWEIESGGLKPYAGLDTAEIIAELKKGYRLEKPNGCSEEMYQVMRSCWNPNPSERPAFDQLVIQLESKVET